MEGADNEKFTTMASTRLMFLCCCCSTQRAHTLRTPKHRSHYHNGRRCGRHNPYIHRPLIGRMWEKRRRRPSIRARPVHLVFPRV